MYALLWHLGEMPVFVCGVVTSVPSTLYVELGYVLDDLLSGRLRVFCFCFWQVQDRSWSC